MKNKSPKAIFAIVALLTLQTILIFWLAISLILILDPSSILFLMILIFSAFVSALISLLIFNLSEQDPRTSSKQHRLVRFESLSHPLMLRMSYEAPGTFHHAVNVSILAQKAAKAIGADALLTRVAAYYHDLGKLDNPSLYIENQSGEEIPKTIDLIHIQSQVQKIIGHVKKGVELASQNHLPEDVINIISEHHGTTQVLYFYELAKENKIKVKRTDFKYEGPSPKTKESAILMLSDSVEAATRSITNLTEDSIREIVETTIKDKVNDKQFKHSGLTENDFLLIKKSLLETLISIYHQRILSSQ